MVTKAGKKKRAITWQVVSYGVSYEKETPQAKLALDGELGELATTPAHGKINTDNDKNIYRDGAGINSPNSLLATKEGELTHPDDMTEVDPGWRARVLQVWEAEGKPVIHLGLGENCFDLAKLLSNPDVKPEHLKAVKGWLESKRRG